jgi:hypothetical protein
MTIISSNWGASNCVDCAWFSADGKYQEENFFLDWLAPFVPQHEYAQGDTCDNCFQVVPGELRIEHVCSEYGKTDP